MLDAVSQSSFLPATQLSGEFYAEVVRPVLGGRRHGAALLGWGSDVLGYDTERSTDHGWGPRLVVFVEDAESVEEVQIMIASRLPERFRGWPVVFGWDAVKPTHHVTVTTLASWLAGHLGVDATAGMSVLDCRYAPYQKWLGTAFARGHHGDGLPEHLTKAVHARDVTAWESALAKARSSSMRRSAPPWGRASGSVASSACRSPCVGPNGRCRQAIVCGATSGTAASSKQHHKVPQADPREHQPGRRCRAPAWRK